MLHILFLNFSKMHDMEALEELGERLNYKLKYHKDEKI
jgi:hypothetical protein